MDRFFLTGAGGFLGHHLRAAALGRGHELLSSQDGLGPLDLTTLGAIEALALSLRPSVIIHAAAIADIAEVKRAPDLAQRVNVDASLDLARAAQRLGAVFVFISSDQVFDGRASLYSEADAPNPLHLYGETKVAVEDWLLQTPLDSLILRLPLMLGPSWGKRRSASDQILDAARDGRQLSLFRDEWRKPAHVKDVAEAILDLVQVGARGLLHLAGPELLSRAQIGQTIAQAFDFQADHIVKETNLVGSALAHGRPARLNLDSQRAYEILGRPLKPAVAAIKELDETCIGDGEV